MRYSIVFFFALVQFYANAQIKGNKQIVTQTFPLEQMKSLEMNLYAQVTVDCAAEATMSITADANLIELIETTLDNGHLTLTQLEWIQPSQEIIVKIGAPDLERIEQSVHETTYVNNLNRAHFKARALIGKLVLEGKVEQLSASGETGAIDARSLDVNEAQVNLWSHGRIELAKPASIKGTVRQEGQIVYDSPTTKVNVKEKSGGKVYNAADPSKDKRFDTRFIDLKIKNNSSNRINCYVKGPKPDGSYFSYGFPLKPGQARKKNWTIGSKVYRVTKLGIRKLLVEIVASDEGQVVKLYP
ncbi:MAG: DUF2807 domain-containing protein [Bacteroidota bacterium]